MNKDQINSAVRTLLKVIGSALVTHGATKAASIVNSEDVIGLVITVIGLLWSHFEHAPVPTANKPTIPLSAWLLIGFVAIGSSGCAIFHQPVPETKIKGSIGGQAFSLVNPKNTTVTNLVVEVSTNGAAKLSIGYISSANDSNVVTGAYAGAAQLVRESGDLAQKAFKAGGEAAGIAGHTAVTGSP
jgi:hypothetical protein